MSKKEEKETSSTNDGELSKMKIVIATITAFLKAVQPPAGFKRPNVEEKFIASLRGLSQEKKTDVDKMTLIKTCHVST